MLPKRHQISNIFRPSAPTMRRLCVLLKHPHTNFKKAVCPENLWMQACQLEKRSHPCRQAYRQINLLAGLITQATTNFTKNCAGKSFFSLKTPRGLFLNFCACHKKGIIRKAFCTSKQDISMCSLKA